jgi:uncharacterized protein YqeY
MANINKDVLRVIKSYIDEAISASATSGAVKTAIDEAISASATSGAVKTAIDTAIATHAALTAGTSAGNVHPGPTS